MFYLKANDPIFKGASMYYVDECFFTPFYENCKKFETREQALEHQILLKSNYGLETEIV